MEKAVVIIGEKGHGKTEFGRRLAAALDTLSTDTSGILNEVENDRRTRVGLGPLFKATDEDQQWFEQQMAKHQRASQNEIQRVVERRIKERDRKYLIALGDAVGRADPTFLLRACLRRGRVVVGCRLIGELREAKKDGLVEAVVWVQRLDYNEGGIDNLELNINDADIVVANDKTPDDLAGKALEVKKWLGERATSERYLHTDGS